MTPPPDPEPSDELADRMDKALEGLWRGDTSGFSHLLDDGEACGFPVGEILEVIGCGARIGTESTLPEQVGDYQIIREIGRGGTGVVYEARQQHPNRRVALKVIKSRGPADGFHVKLFQREVETLARLKHPGIAAIYDAGRTEDGQHFFAMELVSGETLLDYANARPAGGVRQPLGTRERLSLFCKVCDAINYAHQRGVIHRDLKPSNILVSEEDCSEGSGSASAVGCAVKVLDFGLARVIDADVNRTTLLTEAGRIVGTLSYMSPEQACGDADAIDVRSDVYALGVILYELLTGQFPYELSRSAPQQALRTICEEAPRRPSTINRALRGEAETIALKALEKDPARRYQSAAALAEDLRRYLAGQPILARPPSALYHLRKFAARNRALVAVGVIALLALGAMLVRVVRERDRAVAAERLAAQRLIQVQAEADKVKAINQFLNEMLASADPGRDGREVRVADVLARAAESLGTQLGSQPELEAALRNTIGMTYIGLGLYAQAEPHLRSARSTRSRLLGETHPETLETQTNLAATLKELGQLPEAEALVQHTLETRRSGLGPDHRLTLDAMNQLADVLQRQGRVAEAETLWRKTLAAQRRVLRRDDPQLPVTMSNLAQLLKQLGKPAEAESLLREALEQQLEIKGEEHPHTLAAMNNLAMTLKAQGRYDEAETLLRRVVAVRQRTLGDHPSVFLAVNNLARLLQEQGRLTEAES
ncbi:MAG: serine/threonine-protein kinase, partial [Planctomycetota bacterium]